MNTAQKWFSALLMASLISSCSAVQPRLTLEEQLNSLTREATERHSWVPSALAFIQWGDQHWTGSAGVLDRDTQKPAVPESTFRIASITKTFTAASIFRLAEQGQLKLTDSIALHLPEEYVQLLKKHGYSPETITLQQVLSHTSGIPDYADTEPYFLAVFENPKKRWSRLEQVHFALEHFPKVGAPGKTYAYSDTGYVLLGEIIEQKTGQSLGEAFQNLLKLQALGLTSTWQESVQPRPVGAGPFSHPHFGELDAAELDPSNDLWGGGGLVSSTADLVKFFRGLFQGKVISRDSLKEMTTLPGNQPYAHGLYVQRLGHQECWGHTGFWGSAAFYCPDQDITVAVSLNAYPSSLVAQMGIYNQTIFTSQLVRMVEKP